MLAAYFESRAFGHKRVLIAERAVPTVRRLSTSVDVALVLSLAVAREPLVELFNIRALERSYNLHDLSLR